jgi:hypothetical protein
VSDLSPFIGLKENSPFLEFKNAEDATCLEQGIQDCGHKRVFAVRQAEKRLEDINAQGRKEGWKDGKETRKKRKRLTNACSDLERYGEKNMNLSPNKALLSSTKMRYK